MGLAAKTAADNCLTVSISGAADISPNSETLGKYVSLKRIMRVHLIALNFNMGSSQKGLSQRGSSYSCSSHRGSSQSQYWPIDHTLCQGLDIYNV
jgi:hypothetical protein